MHAKTAVADRQGQVMVVLEGVVSALFEGEGEHGWVRQGLESGNRAAVVKDRRMRRAGGLALVRLAPRTVEPAESRLPPTRAISCRSLAGFNVVSSAASDFRFKHLHQLLRRKCTVIIALPTLHPCSCSRRGVFVCFNFSIFCLLA